MQTDIKTLQDTFKISFDAYEDSRTEAEEVSNMFHNRQYTMEQLAILANRGQPAETFNVVKLFGRLLLGYYSTVVNTVKVSPKHWKDVLTASLLNDVVDYTMRTNHMETEGDKIKLDGLLTGLMCSYTDVEDTTTKDRFGRVIRKVVISHVPAAEIAIDPLSRLEDYSDARYLHRFKWVSEEQIKKLFPKKKKAIEVLMAYQNHLLISDAEFEKSFGPHFVGRYKIYNNYLLVHSVIEDDDGKVWSVYWCADEELSREEVTYKEVKFPYRVHKVHTSDRTEFYGIFREVIESQKAINQALCKIQLMVNTQKAFVERKALDGTLDEFTDAFNRVNAVIPVKSLSGVKVESLTREVLDQYTIVDKAFSRIQRVLGVNDSFLGQAFASDSGRKVKLQQNSTILALRYISVRIEQFYRLMGWDIVNLVKQYYTAEQALRITDDSVGERWIQINQPMQMWTGKFDANKQPVMDYVWHEQLDPATNKPMKDDKGNMIVAPVPSRETEIAFTDVDVDIDSTVYNDEDEKNQLLIETFLQGNVGSMLSQVNPAGFLKVAGLAIKSMKTKHSIDIYEILNQTAEAMSQQGNQPPPPPGPGGTPPGANRKTPKSSTLKLPQNTNEGAQ